MSSFPSIARLERLPPVDRAIQCALDEKRLVGAVVLVAHHGRIVHESADGFADREARRPMRTDTLFRLASISKPIASTTVMALIAQGRMGLDDTVHRWLPDFRPRLPDGSVPDITIRQLLTHTAGLGYRFLEASEDGPYARAQVSDGMDEVDFDLTENLRRIASVPLLYMPGTSWCYSLAIDVLGGVIEKVSGESLDSAVRRWVTEPVGMSDTDFHAVDSARLAVAYAGDTSGPHILSEGEVVTPFEGAVGIRYSPKRAFDASAFPSGGAGMVGSAPDLLRLLEALRQGGDPVLPASFVAEMGRNQTGDAGPPDAPGYGFGLGFSVLHDAMAAATPEAPGTWRWGGAYGHSWFVDPARSLTVVAFTNTLYEGMSGQFVGDLRDAVYASLDDGATL